MRTAWSPDPVTVQNGWRLTQPGARQWAGRHHAAPRCRRGSAWCSGGRRAVQPLGALVVEPHDGLAGQPRQPGLHREPGPGLEVPQVPVADREPGKQRRIEGEGARRVHDVEAVLFVDGLAANDLPLPLVPGAAVVVPSSPRAREWRTCPHRLPAARRFPFRGRGRDFAVVGARIRVPLTETEPDRIISRVTSYTMTDVGRASSYPLHRERSSGRYLFDAPASVGHDFGIEIDGFRPSGI